VVILRCSNNNTISLIDFFNDFKDTFWQLLVSGFVKDRKVFDFNKFDVCLICKMFLNILQ